MSDRSEPTGKPKVAVILVPGILASHLEEVWPVNTVSDMAFGQFLASSSAQREKVKKARKYPLERVGFNPGKKLKTDAERSQWHRGWYEVGRDVYLDFLNDCETKIGLPFQPIIWAVGYDFTLSNLESCERIVLKTQEILNDQKYNDIIGFIYITHSMGALTVRAALQKMRGDKELYGKCIGVIHVAAPNTGAPEAIMRLYRGFVGNWKVNLTLGNTGWKVTTVSSALPAFFELLPDYKIFSPSIIGDQPKDDNIYFLEAITNYNFNPLLGTARYNTARGKRGEILADIKDNVRSSIRFWDSLRDYIYQRTAAVCLKRKETVSGVQYEFEKKNLKKMNPITGSGDETVHLESQYAHVKDGWVNEIDKRVWNRSGVKREVSYVVIDGVEHAEPFTGIKKDEIYPAIYNYMSIFFYDYQLKNIDSEIANLEKQIQIAVEAMLVDIMEWKKKISDAKKELDSPSPDIGKIIQSLQNAISGLDDKAKLELSAIISKIETYLKQTF